MLHRYPVAISRRAGIYLAFGVVCLGILGVAGFLFASHYEQHARASFIAAVKKQFDGDVTLGSFHLSVFPRVVVTGDDLVVRFSGRTDIPPLVVAKHFSAKAGLTGFLRYPTHVGSVELSGLQIHLPPKQGSNSRPRVHGSSFVIDRVVADGAVFEVLPNDTRKTPLRFDVKRLDLSSVGGSSMGFHAELFNALPPGLIRTDGRLGAWVTDDPGGTAVSGQYTFRDADLGVFKGIGGTLSSDGRYQGELAKIEVQGTADVPNFVLKLAGNPVPLRTTFAATVDGINGNTDLHPVQATLGNSRFEVSGSIERGAVAHGKEIDLNTKSVKGSLRDFLRLAVKGKEPPMTGTVEFASKIHIPPGPEPVIGKIHLDGRFDAGDVKFTSPEVQEKMASLSHRAEGDPRDHDPGVAGVMGGRFILDKGTMSLSRLEFDLPGAKVIMDGTYTLAGGALDFHGTARLNATVSQMTTGVKRVLLRPVDPLFRHDGAGTVVPIVIQGTRGEPSFRLDIGRAIRGGK